MAIDSTVNDIKAVDDEGNIWLIRLSKMGTKTNRWQLSFFFNEKEFSLSKLQSNQAAQNIWELLQKLRVTPPKKKEEEKQTMNHIEDPKEKSKSRPTKRNKKQEEGEG